LPQGNQAGLRRAEEVPYRGLRKQCRGHTDEGAKTTPCAVCREPATHWSYDGRDPNEQRDPHTGRYWSTDMAHYQPLCAAH
jgi:hypothetical protein